MKKAITKFLYLINLIIGLGLLLSYASPLISPSTFWAVSLFGLAYPLLLAANLLFIIYWIYRLKKAFLFSLVIVLLGYFHSGKFMQFNKQDELPPINSYKILSHNIRAFGLNGPKFQTDDGNKIFKFLDQELYDVYCFQEFFSTKSTVFSPYDSVKKVTGAKYRHVEYLVEFRNNLFGIATLSNHPIVDKGVVPFAREGTNICIYTDIDFDGKIVRIYNMHLQSLHFKQSDVDFLKSMNFENDETIEGAKNIFGRFRSAFKKREEQALAIRQHIDNCPHPVILCGDFNDTPLSYSYQTIKGDFNDTFEEKGKGIGSTYNGMFPLLRIDYILHDPELQCNYFEIKKEDLSDHYPLAAYFTFDNHD